MRTFTTSEGYQIAWNLRQHMAPAMKRILEHLEAHHPQAFADTELAAACWCDRGVAKDACNKLHAAGILRIAQYRRTGATPHALYGFAMGKPDAIRPVPLTNAEKQSRRREHLKAVYGEYAWRVHTSRNGGGAETLVVDGKTVYRRRQA
jgi:hypothetical protein